MGKQPKRPTPPVIEGPSPAKPTTKPKVKTGRVEFPLVSNADEKIYPFAVAIPEGFSFKSHKGLKKRDFTADHLFYEYRALEMDNKATAFRAQAEEAKKLGSVQDRNKARRLVKLQEKMAELKAQLTEQGIDVDELLAAAADTEAA